MIRRGKENDEEILSKCCSVSVSCSLARSACANTLIEEWKCELSNAFSTLQQCDNINCFRRRTNIVEIWHAGKSIGIIQNIRLHELYTHHTHKHTQHIEKHWPNEKRYVMAFAFNRISEPNP